MRPTRCFIGLCCIAAAATLSNFLVSAQEIQQPQGALSAISTERSGEPSPGIQRLAAGAANRVMTLDPLTEEEASARSATLTKTGQKVPANFRQFEALSKGQIGDTQTLTLRFAASTKLTSIKSTPDFKVEQGGSCVEGYSYAANSTCTLLVRSTPQGPGARLGKIEITNSADASPLYVGLGGYGYSPMLNFTPSLISSVSGTSGTISGATSLAIDGGDVLYIADTGNNAIKSINSTGTITNPSPYFGASAPVSIVVDRSGYVYYNTRASTFLYIIPNPSSESYYGSGTTSCSIGATCQLGGAEITTSLLGALAIDPNGTIFMNGYAYPQYEALELVNNDGLGLEYVPLLTPYNYNDTYSSSNLSLPLAVDGSDTLYTYYNGQSNLECVITGESIYNAETSAYKQVLIGGSTSACGFSGDGGQARGALIGSRVGQMTFDIAGNLYFTDTLNQRVRRIDNATGVITTVAGNGSTGNAGDGGPATSASLDSPTGVTVDSQGQVYVLSSVTTTGSTQVVRKVGVVGALNLGSMTVGSGSTAQTVTLANTGNSELDFTHVGFSSGNTTDFAIDPNTTSCNFTVALAAGRSCKIGFIFTPSTTGSRSAVLSITDDTIAGLNTIQVSGTGYTTATLSPASLSFASTTVGSSSAAQSATLANTGKAIMTISSMALSGTGASSYAETTTCGTTLAVGASCTISVTFKPTAVGSLPATLTVNDNAITNHQTVTVTGTGVGVAKAALAPTSLTFASTKVGSTSSAQTIKLSNSGTAALGITSIKMAGTNAADFVLTQACGTSIAAGGSCSCTVSFKPAATGTRTGTVSAVTSAGTVTAATTGTAAAATAVTPKVTLASTMNTLPLRDMFLLSARVTSAAATPTGSVHLMDGGRLMAEGTLSNGVVKFYVTGLSGGKHTMQAMYMGDTHNAKASSADLAIWVNPPTYRLPVSAAPRESQPVVAALPVERSTER